MTVPKEWMAWDIFGKNNNTFPSQYTQVIKKKGEAESTCMRPSRAEERKSRDHALIRFFQAWLEIAAVYQLNYPWTTVQHPIRNN
jgi:hypothetical protein